MIEDKDKNLLLGEVQVAVSFTGLMTAVAIFFAGLLITKFEAYDTSIKIPILFLIISTFGFLYSTLIYANASGLVTRSKHEKFDRNMLLGNITSEYMGVYFLVLSIPLIINVISADTFLRLTTLVVALGGLVLYHVSGFSIMGRHFKNSHLFIIGLIIILETLLFFTQLHSMLLFVTISTIFILLIFLISYYASRKRSEVI